MDQATFKALHPELYAAAVLEGETEERKRVKAHLNLGEKCGDMSIALAAIRSGADSRDQEVISQYLGASMNRADRTARQTESDGAAEATDKATPPPAADTMGEQVASAVEAALGKAKKAS